MRKRTLIGIAVLAAAIGGSVLGAGAAGAPETAPAMDPLAADLLRRLNSASAAERESAKKELADIAKVWQQAELLKQAGEAAGDKDLKALIEGRLEEFKARQALADLRNLPPISLNVRGASLVDLVAALNEALNPQVKLTATRGVTSGWTLEAKDKPFWEVFAALTQQRPLTFNSSGGGIMLTPGGTAIQRYVEDGPAMAYVGAVNYNRSVALQPGRGAEQASPASLTAMVTMAVDPRVRVSRMDNMTLVSATDDAGHTLTPPGSAARNYGGMGNQFQVQFSLTPPADLGKTMTLVCQARLVVQVTTASGSIEDVQNNVDKPLTVGGWTIRMTRFDVGGTGQAQLSVTPPTEQPRGGEARAPVNFSLINGAGATIWAGSTNSTATAMIGGPVNGPFRLEVTIPGKTAEVPVRFEIKDIPLP